MAQKYVPRRLIVGLSTSGMHPRAKPRDISMEPPGKPTAMERLAKLRACPEFVIYDEVIRTGRDGKFRFSILGVYLIAEIFVEITDGVHTRVESFVSRHKSCPPEVRRSDLPLVDTADAFALARKMTHHWPWKRKRDAEDTTAKRSGLGWRRLRNNADLGALPNQVEIPSQQKPMLS